MNEVINNILTRRSIRNFNDKRIDKATLELLVECGLHAPSGMGKDLWHFTIINSEELINELIMIMRKLLNNDNYTMYYPKALIIVSNEVDNYHGMEDNACALENIFLAAHSLNIGSVWINQLRKYNDDELLREYFRKLKIKDNHVVYGIAALGYYDEKTLTKERKGTYEYFE